MYKYDKVSTLIQGPFGDHSVGWKNIDTYLKYGPVVLSSWIQQTEAVHLSHYPGVKYILNPLPSRGGRSHILHNSTFYWAVCSMYHGLKNVETEYVVKTRSDESFSELEPFIEPFLMNDKKMVCGSIFVQKFSKQQFHIGDHIFVAKTKTLLNAVKTLKDIYDGKTEKKTWAHQGPYAAEQVLAFAFLNSNGVNVPPVVNGQSTPYELDVFCENFHVVDVNEVDSYHLSWRHNRKIYKNDFVNPHGVATMEDI